MRHRLILPAVAGGLLSVGILLIILSRRSDDKVSSALRRLEKGTLGPQKQLKGKKGATYVFAPQEELVRIGNRAVPALLQEWRSGPSYPAGISKDLLKKLCIDTLVCISSEEAFGALSRVVVEGSEEDRAYLLDCIFSRAPEIELHPDVGFIRELTDPSRITASIVEEFQDGAAALLGFRFEMPKGPDQVSQFRATVEAWRSACLDKLYWDVERQRFVARKTDPRRGN